MAAAALLTAACTDSHGDGSRTPGDNSTETGNPPVIDIARVALVVSSDEVHVVGEPGAVTPGGGEVEVERVGGDETWRGDVGDDGAFDVRVEGALEDTYVLRAIGGGSADGDGDGDPEPQVSAPVYLHRGGATVGAEDGGTLSCEQQREVITHAFVQAAEAADRACVSDDDCVQGPTPESCRYWQCTGPAVSRSGSAELEPIAASISSELCEPAGEQGCFQHSPIARCGPGHFLCVDGQCTDCTLANCAPPRCAPCPHVSISWGDSFGGRDGDTYEILNCSTLMRRAADGSSCTTEPPCTEAPPCEACSSGRGYSIAYLLAALEDADVVPALARDATFGGLTPAGAFFRIQVGDEGSLLVSPSGCGAQTGCMEAPPGVRALQQVLMDMAVQQTCEPVLAPVVPEACTLPFDPGEGPGEIFVWTFHALTGTCVPQVYTGVGGNENRFDDIESCRAACPTTASAGGCPPNRTFVPDRCLQCGPGGGCDQTGGVCAKLCTTNDDCIGEGPFTYCNPDGTCIMLCA